MELLELLKDLTDPERVCAAWASYPKEGFRFYKFAFTHEGEEIYFDLVISDENYDKLKELE